jgi:hypothetical protein
MKEREQLARTGSNFATASCPLYTSQFPYYLYQTISASDIQNTYIISEERQVIHSNCVIGGTIY